MDAAQMVSGFAMLGPFMGGLGLFLLGMTMMTEGLKLAAGAALERILASATRTRWHALGSGALVTALVQSSSAITVATIGFVNAGLLTLGASLWVLFGANVGTTMTGWIVAFAGLKFKIEALALPLIGLGVLLRITGEGARRGALGTALAGFGLLFLGIAMLQEAFGGIAGRLDLPEGDGVWVTVAQVAVGALMTVLMQSSSASTAVALTAAQGGLIGIEGAAAVVIGANVGTTVKAMLAAIGATSNARRAAAAHVIFNVLTAVVAIALLPWLVGAIGAGRAALELARDPAAELALFHTVFNLLGVLLMWPIGDRLAAWLATRFRRREEDEAQPRFLDDNVLGVPALAAEALRREVARIGRVAIHMARRALAGAQPRDLAADHAVIVRLDRAVSDFVERMNRGTMAPRTSARVARVLRVQRYYETVAEQALAVSALRDATGLEGEPEVRRRAFVQAVDALLARCLPAAEGDDPAGRQAQIDATLDAAAEAGVTAAPEVAMETAYEALKEALLEAGAAGVTRVAEMEEALRRHSALRRAGQQADKAREWSERVEA